MGNFEWVGGTWASSYVEDAAYEGFLLVVEGDAASGFYVGVFDIEVGRCWELLATCDMMMILLGRYLRPFCGFEGLKLV